MCSHGRALAPTFGTCPSSSANLRPASAPVSKRCRGPETNAPSRSQPPPERGETKAHLAAFAFCKLDLRKFTSHLENANVFLQKPVGVEQVGVLLLLRLNLRLCATLSGRVKSVPCERVGPNRGACSPLGRSTEPPWWTHRLPDRTGSRGLLVSGPGQGELLRWS